MSELVINRKPNFPENSGNTADVAIEETIAKETGSFKGLLQRAQMIRDSQARSRDLSFKDMLAYAAQGEEEAGKLSEVGNMLRWQPDGFEAYVQLLELPGSRLNDARAKQYKEAFDAAFPDYKKRAEGFVQRLKNWGFPVDSVSSAILDLFPKPDFSKWPDSLTKLDKNLVSEQVKDDVAFAKKLSDLTIMEKSEVKMPTCAEMYMTLTDPSLPNGYVSWQNTGDTIEVIQEALFQARHHAPFEDVEHAGNRKVRNLPAQNPYFTITSAPVKQTS